MADSLRKVNFNTNRQAVWTTAALSDKSKINENSSADKDKFISSHKNLSSNASSDGKFSFLEAMKNFGKGLFSPVTSMFSSGKNFLIGTSMIIGGAVLTAITGGAILPLFIASGIAYGLIQGGTGIYKILKAKNGDDIEKAFGDFGTATSSIGLSLCGVKSVVQKAGFTSDSASTLEAVLGCFKNAPKSILNSYKNIKSNYQDSLQLRGELQEYLKTYKEYKHEVKPIAEEIYEEEIKLLADRLGVSEKEIRAILPKKPGYTLRNVGGSTTHHTKPIIKLSPVAMKTGGELIGGRTIRERVECVLPHEVRHMEQMISPINQLSYREYRAAIDEEIAHITNCPAAIVRTVRSIDFILRRYSTIGKRIKSLDLSKTPNAKLEAVRLARIEIQACDAMISLAMGSDVKYLNCYMEVDARMYSMLRRIRIMADKIEKAESLVETKKCCSSRSNESVTQQTLDPSIALLRNIQNEFTRESNNFKWPEDPTLQLQLKTIKSELKKARTVVLSREPSLKSFLDL